MNVSVVIPTFNYAHFLSDAIESVLFQSAAAYLDKIFIIDDGSTDNTTDVIRRYSKLYPFIKHIQTEHRGASSARNLGIAQCESPLVAFLDADDIWLSKKLEIQLSYFSMNPELQLCTCQGLNFCNDKDIGNLSIANKKDDTNQASDIPLPSGWVAKRALFSEFGLFDDTLTIAHDFELFLRFTRQQVQWNAITQVLYHRRVHDNNISRDHRRNRMEIFQVLGERRFGDKESIVTMKRKNI